MCNLWILGLVEAFRRLIPVGTHPLTCELYLILVLLDNLAETEVSDLDLPVVEDDVLWLQIVVNDLLFLIS